MMKKLDGRKTSRIFMLALFLLFLTHAPAPIRAQEPEGPPPASEGRPANPEGDLVRQLNLTPDQIARIRAIRQQNREARQTLGMRLRAARQALDRAIYVENADEAVVEQRARELAEAQAANIRLQAMTELGIRRILTPQQLETLRNLRAQAAERQGRNRRRGALNANRPPGDDENPRPLRRGLRRGPNSPGQTNGNNGQGLSPRQPAGRP